MSLASTSLRALHKFNDIRLDWDERSRERKFEILKGLDARGIATADALTAYHDALLFLEAYPHSAAMLRLVRLELKRLARDVRSRCLGDEDWRQQLLDSGLAGSEREDSFSIDLWRWLAEVKGTSLRFVSRDHEVGEDLREFLQSFVLRVAADAAISSLGSADLLELAQPRRSTGSVKWLLSKFDHMQVDETVKDLLFNSLKLWVRWRVVVPLSRTCCRFPRRTPYFYREELKLGINVPELLSTELPLAGKLSARAARRLIDAGRATLAARGRETDPVTYADARDVQLFRLERGVDVALFGLSPERRLPIETYIGFVVAKNTVPIGYGGAWILGHSCEIGVNLFEIFRGGDSAHVFASIMRVFRQRYNVNTFYVHPNQFGDENEEGLSSGAFWFYYKLGFRPLDPAITRLCEREVSRKAQSRNYRSAPVVLKRLTGDSLAYSCAGAIEANPMDVRDIGLALMDMVRRRFKGEIRRAEEVCMRGLLTWGRIGGTVRCSAAEKDAVKRLSLIFGALGNARSWSGRQRRELFEVFRSKGGRRESDYILKVQRHALLLGELAKLAQHGRIIAERGQS